VNRFVEKLRAGPGKPDRIADLRELLDRIDAILDLIIAEGGVAGAAPDGIETLAERFGLIAVRLRQISETFHAVHATMNETRSRQQMERNEPSRAWILEASAWPA
jgi:hypothetical protein